MNIASTSPVSGAEWPLHPTRLVSKCRFGFACVLKQLSTVLFATVVLAVSGPSVRASGEQVDLLLVLAADVSYSICGRTVQITARGLRAGDHESAGNPRYPIGRNWTDRHLFYRMVSFRLW